MKVRERSGFQGLLIGGALGILSGLIAGAVKEPKDRETWGNDCWFECSNGGMMYMYGLMLGVAGLLAGATIGRSIEHDSVLSLDPAPATSAKHPIERRGESRLDSSPGFVVLR